LFSLISVQEAVNLKKEAILGFPVGSIAGGKPVLNGGGAGPVRWTVFLLCPFVFSFCVTCIYLGMRGVMRLGGFVASGGPYSIAHPAPDWIWIFPVSMLLMMASIFVSMFASSRISGPNIMALSWSALFISLGWNFVEFGFGIGMGGWLAPGWIICAVLFAVMGLVPLFFVVRAFIKHFTKRSGFMEPSTAEESVANGQLTWTTSILLQFALAGIGIWLGLLIFGALS